MKVMQTGSAVIKSFIFDFAEVRDEITAFIMKNAQIINVYALEDRHDRVYPLQQLIDNDNGGRLHKSVKDEIVDLTERLAQNLLSAALVSHFYSVPESYENCLYQYGTNLLIRDIGERPNLEGLSEDEIVHLGESRLSLHDELTEWFDDLILAYVNAFFDDIDPWATVDAKLTGNKLTVIVGEDLRHVYFKRQCGTGRWRGEYILPDNTTIP